VVGELSVMKCLWIEGHAIVHVDFRKKLVAVYATIADFFKERSITSVQNS